MKQPQSQFFILFKPARHLDNKHVVFGKVIEGTEVIQMLENVRTTTDDKPTQDVTISECGEM